jgi:hypothetical protein
LGVGAIQKSADIIFKTERGTETDRERDRERERGIQREREREVRI